jgi:predicted permease
MIVDDLKYGWRQLVKAPGFTVTAVLTLGLAIGANTAVFSLVDAALLKSLPYLEPERLGSLNGIYTRNGAVVDQSLRGLDGRGWQAVRDQATSVHAAIFAGLSARVNLVTDSRTMTVAPQRVSAGYFRVMGVPPAIGREFTPEEDVTGGPALAILSHALWQSAFNGDASVVGRDILLRGEPHTVIGVMPASFRSNSDAELWTPLRPSLTGEGSGTNYGLVVRLKDGVAWPQASADVGAAADSALARRTSASGVTVSHALIPLQEQMTNDVRLPLILLTTSVALVLLVACVNLAGLLLARAGRRTREIATRLAVGGDRRAVIRQLLIESLLLALLGGLAGLAFGAVALEILKAGADQLLLTPWAEVSLDARVLSVTLGLTALTAILFGLVPAIQATRLDVQAALAEGGTRAVAGGAKGWPRRLLVVAEVALGVVLLVGAGLLMRTFMHLQSQAPGFDPRQIRVASASLEDARYEQHERVQQLFDRSLDRIRAMPGVESAAVSLGLPYERILNMGARVIGTSGEQSDYRFTTATYVTPGYFETLKLPVLRGRTLQPSDTSTSAHVVVVNQSFVDRYLKDRDPVGQHVFMNGNREIVGVVANVQQRGGFNGFGPLDALPAIYMPFSQFQRGGLRTIHGWFSPAWIVRETKAGAVTDLAMRRAMEEIDPQLPLASIRGIDEVQSAALSRQRVLMLLVAVLGGLALSLAAIGIHALILSGVTERTRELGIRMALGATVGQTVIDAARPGIVMTLVGLAIGCALAWGASGLIRNLLWGVRQNDPVTFVAVIGILFAVAVVASVLPALRIRKFDPVALLRSE